MPAFLSHSPLTDESVGADLLVVPVNSEAGTVPARLGRLGHVIFIDQALYEILVGLGNFRLDGSTGVMLGHARWQHQIDTKGFVAHQASNLGQLSGDFFRKPAGCTIYPEATRQADGRNGGDIVGKSKYGCFYT